MRTAGEGAGGCRRGKKQRDTEGGMSSASHLECQTLAVHLGIFQRQPKITCLYLYTAFYIFFISPFILGFYPPNHPVILSLSQYHSCLASHFTPFLLCHVSAHLSCQMRLSLGCGVGVKMQKTRGKRERKRERWKGKKRVLTQRKRHKHFLIRWVVEEGQRTGAGSVCEFVCVFVFVWAGSFQVIL